MPKKSSKNRRLKDTSPRYERRGRKDNSVSIAGNDYEGLTKDAYTLHENEMSTKTHLVKQYEDEEEVEISSRSTQTAPSHKEQASTTNNHLSHEGHEAKPKTARKSRKTKSDFHQTTQADFEEFEDGEEGLEFMDDSHAGTQTFEAKDGHSEDKTAHYISPNKVEQYKPEDDEEDCAEENCDDDKNYTKEPKCCVKDECFQTETETCTSCGGLEVDELFGVALDETSQFVWYLVSKCLDFMKEDCDADTHPVGKRAVGCAVKDSAEGDDGPKDKGTISKGTISKGVNQNVNQNVKSHNKNKSKIENSMKVKSKKHGHSTDGDWEIVKVETGNSNNSNEPDE